MSLSKAYLGGAQWCALSIVDSVSVIITTEALLCVPGTVLSALPISFRSFLQQSYEVGVITV